MATGKTGSFEIAGTKGATAKFTWAETYDVIKNTHVVSITALQIKFSSWYGFTYYLGSNDNNGYIKIGDTQVVRFQNIQGSHNIRNDSLNTYYSVNAASGYSGVPWTSGTITGESDGSCKVTISFDFYGFNIEGEGAHGWRINGSQEITLTTIDRTAPTIGCSVNNVTSSGFKINATSNVTADVWQYSIDGGSNWTQFSTTAGTAASVTISDLSPNTTYQVKVKARKKTNQVYGTSAAVPAKTLGASVIVKTYSFDADVDEPVIKVNLTVYDGNYYHKLSVKKESTIIFSVSLGKLTAGTADRSYTLGQTERADLLEAMSTVKSQSFNIVIATYSDSGYSKLVGSESSKAATANTASSRSAPTFSGFTYADVRNTVVEATANDQVLVQNYSSLRVTCNAGAAKNGATISGYSASIGDASKSGSGTTLNVGAVGSSGSLTLTVTCTDSRGYATTVRKTVKVLRYSEPKLSSYKLRRMNEIEGLVQLSFSGSISSLKPDDTNEVNEITGITYWYKKTDEEEWSENFSLKDDASINGTSFSFASLELLELDPESSYDFHIQILDKLYGLTAMDLYVVLPQGIPIVALRKRNTTYNFPRVGINNPHPKYPLDVGGDIAMNGFVVLGYRGVLSGENFNSLSDGIWEYLGDGSSYNAPVESVGFLEVITDGTIILQRFTAITAAHPVYLRSYDGSSWTEWTAK